MKWHRDGRIGAAIVLLAVVGLMLGAAMITGCDQSIELLGDDKAPSEMQVVTDICLPMDRVRTWNPLLSADEDVYYVEKMIYEGLFRLNEQLEAEPVLAESWSFDKEGTKMTVHLKSGVQWHDGKSMTAEDVKFTVEALKSSNSLYKAQANIIRSVKVNDDRTVVLTFADSNNSSLEKLTFPILPKHQYKNASAWLKASEKFTPVGTGRYQVEKIKTGEEIRLVSNLSYHGSGKASNTVTFKVASDNANLVNLFAISDLNLVFLRDIDRETMYSNKDVDILNFPANEAEILGFNTMNPLLSQEKLRQAIAYSIDVTQLLDHVYYNNGIATDSLYYPDYLGMENEGDPYECNVEAAKALLRELGYQDGEGGMFRDGDGKLLSITLTVNDGSVLRRDAAAMIQEQLLQAGIDCQIRFLDWASYQSAIASRNYEMFLGGYSFNEAYDLRFLLHSGYGNPAGYSNADVDECLTTMEQGAKSDEKRTAYSEMKTVLKKELPYYCLFYKTYGRMAAWRLQTESAPLFCDVYRGAEEWRLTKDKNIEILDSAQ